jgi:uncharacterized coiled-coil DUF342 family protein
MTLPEIMTALGAVGGLGGLATALTVFLQRKKFKAEAADVLTDTALTLVEPLQQRVKEVTAEAREARDETRRSRVEVAELRETLTDIMATLRRWRSAVLSPQITREELQQMVRADEIDAPRN